MMQKVLNFLQSLILVPILMIGVPVVLVAKLFEKPVCRSSAEVDATLQKMASSVVSEDLWDAFLSIPIEDKSLDKVREEVEVLWAYEEFLTENEEGYVVLNDKGLAKLSAIQKELRDGINY